MSRFLCEVMLDQAGGFDRQVRGMLQVGRRMLGLRAGLVSELKNGQMTVNAARCGIQDMVASDAMRQLGSVLGMETIRRGQVLAIEDMSRSPFQQSMHASDWQAGCCIGAPIETHDGVWGALQFADVRRRDHAFSEMDHDFCTFMGRWVGGELDRVRANERVRTSQAELMAMYAASPLGMFLTDVEGLYVRVNERYEELSGLHASEARGTGWLRAVHPDDRARAFSEWELAVSRGEDFHSIHRFLRKDGVAVWTSVRASQIRDGERLLGFVGSIEDVTIQQRAQDELRRAAYEDPLTGLRNRTVFMSLIRDAITRRRLDPRAHFALMFLDFDGFKKVNDTHGHDTGDELLISIAGRMRQAASEMASQEPTPAVVTPARLGGDEFVMLLSPVHDVDVVKNVARRLCELLAQPHDLGVASLTTPASIGVVTDASGFASAEEAIRAADQAMYRAKSRGGNDFEECCAGQSSSREQGLRAPQSDHGPRDAHKSHVARDTKEGYAA